jgi:hypothetical protein
MPVAGTGPGTQEQAARARASEERPRLRLRNGQSAHEVSPLYPLPFTLGSTQTPPSPPPDVSSRRPRRSPASPRLGPPALSRGLFTKIRSDVRGARVPLISHPTSRPIPPSACAPLFTLVWYDPSRAAANYAPIRNVLFILLPDAYDRSFSYFLLHLRSRDLFTRAMCGKALMARVISRYQHS